MKFHGLQRWMFAALLICVSGSFAPVVRADSVLLKMFPFTGEIRLVNSNAATFSFVEYSLFSPGGALNGNPAVWKSISDNYDVSSSQCSDPVNNLCIDPLNDWLKLSSSPTELTEGVIPNPGGSLAPFRSVSFGNIWNSAVPVQPDVTAQITQANHLFASVTRDFAIDGDYNQDDMVNMNDYLLWKAAYGHSGDVFAQWADGNLDGVVDAADYTIWRNNAGLTLAGTGFASASGSSLGLAIGRAVPEPSAAVVSLIAAGLMLLGCRGVLRRAYCSRSSTAW